MYKFNVKMVLKNEFARFGKTTSIKGVPRIFNSTETFLRIMWFTAVCFGTSITVLHLSHSLKDYFSYQTFIHFKRESTMPIFPDVSVCKTSDLNIQKIIDQSAPDYIKRLRGLMLEYPLIVTEDIVYSLNNTYGYFENIAKLVPTYKSQLREDFVVSCQWTLSSTKYIHCNMTEIEYFSTPEFMRCFRFKARNQELLDKINNTFIEGLSVIFFLEDTSFVNLPPLDLTYFKTMANGIRVAIHPPDTLPSMKKALNAPAGFETSFRIQISHRHLLPEPHGDCTNNRYTSFINDLVVKDYIYSEEYCYALCNQKHALEKCGCLDIKHPVSDTLMVEYPFCGVILDNITLTVERIKCRNALRQSDVNCRCPEPCDGSFYLLDSGSAPWPHESFHLEFFKQNIENQSYHQNFQIYANLSSQYQRGIILNDDERMSLFEELKKYQDLRRSFGQLNVYLGDHKKRNFVDEEALNLSTLLANIGGTMNLWIGITFCTLIEILEMIYRLICHNIRKVETDSNLDQTKETQSSAGEADKQRTKVPLQ